MPDYTIELDGHTFASAPDLRVRCELEHRLDSVPEKVAYLRYTLTFPRARVYSSDGTADKAQELFGTYLTNTHHKSTGVKPRWVKIRDAAAAVIDEIGDVDTTGNAGWQELLVEAYELEDGPAQFRAGVEFQLVVRATKAIVDANNMAMLERDWSSSIGPDGLEVQTLESRVEMKAGTTIDYAASWFLALVRLSKPSGWVRTIGGADGFEVVSLPRYSREDRGLFRSQVKKLGGSVSVPSGAGGVSVIESRREDPELNLVEVVRSVEAVGAGVSAGNSWLEQQRPTGAHGERSTEQGNTLQHRAAWRTWEPLVAALGGKVYALDVVRTLQPGGQLVRVARRSGKLPPVVRRGALLEWALVEEIVLHGLGVLTLADLPSLPAPPGAWAFDPESSDERPAVRVEKGAAKGQHRWQRTIRRRFVWEGASSPLDDAAFAAVLATSYDAGEKGVVLE